MPTYQISATQMKIVRDQRLPLVNLEGELELQARFTAGSGQAVQFPANGWVTGKQGQIIAINQNLGTSSAGSVAVKVEITELEPKGMAGDPDYGTATAVLSLNGDPRIESVVSIQTSADSGTERSAILEVTLVAVRQQ